MEKYFPQFHPLPGQGRKKRMRSLVKWFAAPGMWESVRFFTDFSHQLKLKIFSKLTIRKKIILQFSIVLFMISITFFLASSYEKKKHSLNYTKNEIQNILVLFSNGIASGLKNLNFHYIQQEIEWLKKDPRLTYFLILDKQNNLIAKLNKENLDLSFPNLLDREIPFVFHNTLISSKPIIAYDPITEKDSYLGTVYIGLSLKTFNEEMLSSIYHSALIILVVFIAGVLLSTYLSRQISNPILHLADISNKIASSNQLHLRATRNTDDELGTLTSNFNEMVARIQEQQDNLKEINHNLDSLVISRTKDLVKSKEEAEQANRAKTHLLAQISHEFKTPLNAILGFSQLLVMRGKDNLTKEQLTEIERIIEAGQYLLKLVNQILNLTEAKSGELKVEFKKVDIDDLKKEVLPMVIIPAKKNDIKIIDSPINSESLYIKADPFRLKQVFLNLFMNAIKYNRKGGSVEFKPEIIEGNRLRLNFVDTGIGISKEDQARVFEPFDRLSMAHSGIEGNGIGLAYSKLLIEMMNGSIGFESVEGKGSCFYIDLPRFE